MDINSRISKLENEIEMLNYLLKKLNNLLKKRCPEKITGKYSVLLGRDCFAKVYKKYPTLFKNFKNYDSNNINLIYDSNHTDLEFKMVIYKKKQPQKNHDTNYTATTIN